MLPVAAVIHCWTFLFIISATNFILEKAGGAHTFMGAISPHIMAFLISFAVSFSTGYLLNRFIVFPGSTPEGQGTIVPLLLLVLVCIGLNYIFIKLFVEQFHFYPTVAKILTTVIVVSFSYLTQKQFTFKVEAVK